MASFSERLRTTLTPMVMGACDDGVPPAIMLWQRLAAALVPVMGADGFQSLFARSLHLSGAHYPWLVVRQAGTPSFGLADQFAGLQNRLDATPPAEATQATVSMLVTFVETLTQVIGEPLIQSVLRRAWGGGFICQIQAHSDEGPGRG